MKKYRVSFVKKFTKEATKVDYYALELTDLSPAKDKNSGAYLGHRTYSVINRCDKIPFLIAPDDIVKCSISFDNETKKPFAFHYTQCEPDNFDEELTKFSFGEKERFGEEHQWKELYDSAICEEDI